MISKLTVLGVVTALLLSGTMAFAAVPDAAAGNAADSHEISECTVIDESGHYTVTNNITNESADVCIAITAADVTLDGDGHTVDGVDGNGTGVRVYGPEMTNVTVREVSVTGFERGVRVYESAGALVDSTVENNSGPGIDVRRVDNYEFTFAGNDISNNGDHGVSSIFSHLVLTDNRIVGNDGNGFSATDSWVRSSDNVIENNDGHGISTSWGGVESSDDVIANNSGHGIMTQDYATIDGSTIRNSGGDGVHLETVFEVKPSTLSMTDSDVVGNAGYGVHIDRLEGELGSAEIDDSVIAENGELGINNEMTTVVNATGNYWGASDGPSSANDEDAPFTDPVTGEPADGSGDEVSEHPENSGQSNVHFDPFLSDNPNEDGDEGDETDSDDGEQDGDESDETDGDEGDETDSDEGEQDGDESDETDSDESDDEKEGDDSTERPSDERAYQFDLAVGEVIEDIGEDDRAFYGRQGRLVRAMTFAGDGTTTGHHAPPESSYAEATGSCDLTASQVDYDSETGEATATFHLGDDAECEGLTVTFAAYELPGDDMTFVREHADEQELVDYETVTLEPGESAEITLSVGDESDE